METGIEPRSDPNHREDIMKVETYLSFEERRQCA